MSVEPGVLMGGVNRLLFIGCLQAVGRVKGISMKHPVASWAHVLGGD